MAKDIQKQSQSETGDRIDQAVAETLRTIQRAKAKCQDVVSQVEQEGSIMEFSNRPIDAEPSLDIDYKSGRIFVYNDDLWSVDDLPDSICIQLHVYIDREGVIILPSIFREEGAVHIVFNDVKPGDIVRMKGQRSYTVQQMVYGGADPEWSLRISSGVS